MISLNLLSPEKKQDIKMINFYILIKNLVILLILLTIVIATILLIAKITLQNFFNEVIEQTTLTTKYANTFNKDVRTFNKNLTIVETIQKDHIFWVDFLVNFSALVPEAIKVDNISINKNKILITGFAKTREALQKFEDNLKNSGHYDKTEIPFENLLKKENIDYNLMAEIKLDNFKRTEKNSKN